MAGLLQSLPIYGEVPSHLWHIEATQANEDGIAHLTDLREGLLGGRRNTDGRMRLLIGFRQHAQVVAGVVFPLIRETLLRPGFEDDLEMLMKTLTAFRIEDGIAFIGPRETTPPDPKVETPFTDLVHGGRLLG